MSDTPTDTVTFVVPAEPGLSVPQGELTSLAAVLAESGFHRDFDPTLPPCDVEPGTTYGNDAFGAGSQSADPLADFAHQLSETFPNVPFKLYSDPAERNGTWALGSLYRYQPGLGLHPARGEHVACDGNGNAYVSTDQVLTALAEGFTRVNAVL